MKRLNASFAMAIAVFFALPRPAFSQAATSGAGTAGKPATVAPSRAKFARIVFVSKRDVCECTRKAIDASLVALKQALGTAAAVPVEEYQVETDLAKIEPLRKQKPFFTFPAIYFVDGKGIVVELLQGEQTAAQITALLEGRARDLPPDQQSTKSGCGSDVSSTSCSRNSP